MVFSRQSVITVYRPGRRVCDTPLVILREDLDRERIPVSTASKSIIAYCNGTRDYMVPSVWGTVPKGEDPYAPQQSGGCCVVM
ncbi:hypothetical protein TgHK011_006224 [Trichoderma gracile]|nr:hypothetical protein TgHK011_006224 [Trichoderma gracile]